MKTYLFRYNYNGGQYGFEIPADSLDEAWERVGAIRNMPVGYDGTLEAKIPAAVGWWVPLYVWVRNLFRRDRGA